MRYSVKLLDSTSSITAQILAALQENITQIINKALPRIETDLKNLVADALRQEPEYQSLLGGTLKAEFGISDSASVERIIEALTSTLNITQEQVEIGRNSLKGGFSITMMKSDDMDGVIFLDSASVVDTQRGYSLPWLEWLLYENNRPIVKNYLVDYTNSPYSRSGLAIMVPDDSNWRVPPQFAGSTRNNWTTRAISRIESNIYNTIISNIESVL